MKLRMLAATAALAIAAPAVAGPHYSSGPSYTPDLLPPVSNAGECYARVKIPARYESRSQTVMTHAPYETHKVTEPKFQSRTESVMVKEPSVRYEVRQPSFKSVTEKILTRPAYEKLSVSAPQFSTVTESFTMSEPKLVWKKGNPGELMRQGYIIHSTADAGAGGRGYSSTTQYGASGGDKCGPTCEIWCLVEEPGVQKSFQRRVMSSPGEVRRHAVPAQYQTITKQVVSDPGGVREVPVPGEFRNITVHDLVEPAQSYSEMTPPTYGDVQGKVMVEAERYEWRRVVCQPGTQGYISGSSYSGGSYSSGSSYSGSTYSSGSSYSSGSISGQHMGGHHSGHQHGADHYGSQNHSGSVHSGHAHKGHESYRELGGYSSGSTYSSGGSYSSGSIYDQPAYSSQSQGLAGGHHLSHGYKRSRKY